MSRVPEFCLAASVAWTLFFPPAARADERILDFHSDISIETDASLDVTETIKVRAEGNAIRHGIFRDFPTRYTDELGNNVAIHFDLLDTERDDNAEPSHVENKSNGVFIYLGDKDATLVPGIYTYVLHYQVTRELGFFDGNDELFWNATGNGWDFPIDHASAHVELPSEIAPDKLQAFGYTGAQGARGKDLTASIDGVSEASFATTRTLAPRTGMSVVLKFPKHIVAEPGLMQKIGWLLSDNAALLVGLVGLVGLWIYYMWAWRAAGRDPSPGVIIAQYDPPAGFSPAALRYVQRMAYDNRCFSSDLVAMAVGGFLTIQHDDHTASNAWSLLRPTTAVNGPTDASQRALWMGLLPNPGDCIELKDDNAATISAARNAHQASLQSRFEKRYFVTNSGALLPAIAWTVLIGLAVFITGSGGGMALGIVLLLLMVATNLLFARLMKAQTDSGRKLLDLSDGLKLYLSVADRDELHALKLPGGPQPAIDSARYQGLLPYAMALEVEEAWTRRFTAAVGVAAAASAASSAGWYSGTAGLPMDFSSMGSSFGSSLDSAISSSSSPPGSSSGDSGSSGGGGGGGGGGGW